MDTDLKDRIKDLTDRGWEISLFNTRVVWQGGGPQHGQTVTRWMCDLWDGVTRTKNGSRKTRRGGVGFTIDEALADALSSYNEGERP